MIYIVNRTPQMNFMLLCMAIKKRPFHNKCHKHFCHAPSSVDLDLLLPPPTPITSSLLPPLSPPPSSHPYHLLSPPTPIIFAWRWSCYTYNLHVRWYCDIQRHFFQCWDRNIKTDELNFNQIHKYCFCD